jgi:hypothetical protein
LRSALAAVGKARAMATVAAARVAAVFILDLRRAAAAVRRLHCR